MTSSNSRRSVRSASPKFAEAVRALAREERHRRWRVLRACARERPSCQRLARPRHTVEQDAPGPKCEHMHPVLLFVGCGWTATVVHLLDPAARGAYFPLRKEDVPPHATMI